jgi:hypothetical protein
MLGKAGTYTGFERWWAPSAAVLGGRGPNHLDRGRGTVTGELAGLEGEGGFAAGQGEPQVAYELLCWSG